MTRYVRGSTLIAAARNDGKTGTYIEAKYVLQNA